MVGVCVQMARSRDIVVDMKRVCISGIGVEIPEASISNEALVECFNTWVERENAERCKRGEKLLATSSAEFIEQASGIKNRHVFEREGILDPERMTPNIPAREDDDLSVMAEFGAKSARKALADANLEPAEIDMIICSAAHLQRPYPAIAIEMQKELGTSGAGFDMNLGCSSAIGAIHVAVNLVRTGAQKKVLIVTPELITGHLNFRDRQTHFIFGDASVAMVVEALEDDEVRSGKFEIIDTRNWTKFSNNIRTNFGFLLRAGQEDVSVVEVEGNLIKQVGNKVFKEVTHAGCKFIIDFLRDNGLHTDDVRRFWLHQANARMNSMILKMSLGGEVGPDRAPTVLERLGNTAAAGAIIAVSEHHRDMERGDFGLICAYGAGYSIGGAIVRMM